MKLISMDICVCIFKIMLIYRGTASTGSVDLTVASARNCVGTCNNKWNKNLKKNNNRSEIMLIKHWVWWNCGCMTVAEAGDDKARATQDILFSDVPRHCNHVCCVVPVRAYRPNDRRDPCWRAWVAVLDKADCSCNRFHWRACVYVCSVQNVHAAVSPVASVQPGHLCPGLLQSSSASNK